MRIVYLLLLGLVSGSLQGCFPVVAAGAGAGAMIAQDRRTTEVYVHDQEIESKSAALIDQQIDSVMHVNVTSFDYHVLISGELPDDATKKRIDDIVSGIEYVRVVYNELAVPGTSSLASRSNDVLISSNVKLRFVNDNRFNAELIKVVTEDGTVYLMGLVKHEETDAASDIASTAQGVQRVVRLFEYIN